MTLHECPECGTTNNTWVNSRRCYSCGHEWTTRPAARTLTGP